MTGPSTLEHPSETMTDQVPVLQRVASPLASHGKRRPSLLHKEPKGNGRSSPGNQKKTQLQDQPSTKRRFSLRDAVRKVLARKHKRAKANDSAAVTEKSVSITPQDTEVHRNEGDGGTPQIATPESPSPLPGPLSDTARGSTGAAPINDIRPPSPALTPPTSSSSKDSIQPASTASLSPRPTGHHRQQDPLLYQSLQDEPEADHGPLLLFEGAPIFYVDESEGKYGNPSVRYQASEPTKSPAYPASSPGDAGNIDHEAFRSCSNRAKQGTGSQHHWLEGPVETPSIVSFFGLEPGSTGWQYFLEAQMEDYELQHGLTCGEIDEYGLEFQAPDSIGVRSIDSTTMVDRLREIGKLHGQGYKLEADIETETRTLYGLLFSKLLYPTRRRSETIKPQELSLESQCRELFKVLEERHVWLDFSRPEERIRLGSILYGNGEEKLLLVLQILLSCELWLRLKILHQNLPEKLELESLYFTPKVNWDLAVAQKWLTNVRIVERPLVANTDMLLPIPPSMQNPNVWHRVFSIDGTKIENDQDSPEGDTYDAFFVPQHLERQLDGLMHFARKIGWPGVEMLEGVIRDKLRDPAGLQTPGSFLSYKTAPNSPSKLTPRSIGGSSGSSYFGYFTSKHTSSAVVRNMGQGGWLSRTYTTGLILPGEGLPHLLMGCLLESDTLALEEIGEQGSMYGGIIRTNLEGCGATSSWWSMNNVVGKVLATENSGSYAGWVGRCAGIYSARKAPQDDEVTVLSAVAAKVVRNLTFASSVDARRNGMRLVEPSGWVDVIADRKSSTKWPPRLLSPGSIELDSKLLSDTSSDANDQAQEDELHFPETTDGLEDFRIQVLGLKFWDCDSPGAISPAELEHGYSSAAPEDPHASGGAVPAYRVEVVFRFPGVYPAPYADAFDSAEDDRVSVMLKHDVSFITSYPCYPPRVGPRVESPVSLSALETVSQDLGPISNSANFVPAGRECRHPIRSSLRYKIVDVCDLHEHSPARRRSATGRSARSASKDKSKLEEYFVTVVRAKDLEADIFVYAKAWCAKWGADAVVARPERTCISCAVREAYALGVDAVITAA
ncbi:hypothetical protein Dda_2901 [Drechslerella dactyloides]|uniref:Uncharacterized protein n=1 Tax=Drechslerella dactyloides TaxID=74499 RepID=A0AAD6J4P7_DREDA|nr:hypothetical protein Dda_2901 [Drechslerella dactyloides]